MIRISDRSVVVTALAFLAFSEHWLGLVLGGCAQSRNSASAGSWDWSPPAKLQARQCGIEQCGIEQCGDRGLSRSPRFTVLMSYAYDQMPRIRSAGWIAEHQKQTIRISGMDGAIQQESNVQRLKTSAIVLYQELAIPIPLPICIGLVFWIVLGGLLRVIAAELLTTANKHAQRAPHPRSCADRAIARMVINAELDCSKTAEADSS